MTSLYDFLETNSLYIVMLIVLIIWIYENDTINSSTAFILFGSTSTAEINSQTKNSIRL